MRRANGQTRTSRACRHISSLIHTVGKRDCIEIYILLPFVNMKNIYRHGAPTFYWPEFLTQTSFQYYLPSKHVLMQQLKRRSLWTASILNVLSFNRFVLITFSYQFWWEFLCTPNTLDCYAILWAWNVSIKEKPALYWPVGIGCFEACNFRCLWSWRIHVTA